MNRDVKESKILFGSLDGELTQMLSHRDRFEKMLKCKGSCPTLKKMIAATEKRIRKIKELKRAEISGVDPTRRPA